MRAGDFWGERAVPPAPVSERAGEEPPTLDEPQWWQGERRLGALLAEIRAQVRPRAEALLAALAREEALAEGVRAAARVEGEPKAAGTPPEPEAAPPEPAAPKPPGPQAAAPRLIAIPGLEDALGGTASDPRRGRR